jgi:hypothetical protein
MTQEHHPVSPSPPAVGELLSVAEVALRMRPLCGGTCDVAPFLPGPSCAYSTKVGAVSTVSSACGLSR